MVVERSGKIEFLDSIKPHYFLTMKKLNELTQIDRLCPVLVRCGAGRFTCASQNVSHFITIIENEGSDYVRDISIPVEELKKYGIH